MSAANANAAWPRSMLVVNVNGLNGATKRRHFFSRLMHGSWDVETHCPSQQVADAWLQEGAGPGQPWRGSSFWCVGSSASRGVAVLFSSEFAGSDLRLDAQSEDGRLLRVSWQLAPGRRCACLAVYAPVVPEARSLFFGQKGPLQQALATGHTGSEHVILARRLQLCVVRLGRARGRVCSGQPGSWGSRSG
jgi:hypothetical protein